MIFNNLYINAIQDINVSENNNELENIYINLGENDMNEYDGKMNYYLKKEGKIYFVKNDFVDIKYYEKKILLAEADYNSFTILGEADNRKPDIFAKDDISVYCNGEIIEGADSLTFEYLKNYFAKDKYNVYTRDSIIDGANPETFSVLSNIYGKDKSNVYYFNVQIKGADVDTFLPFGDFPYAIDKNQVFFINKPLLGADYSTFDVLDGYYTRDSKNIYFFGKKMEKVDIESLKIINKNFIIDKNYVYQDGIRIEKSDPDTFEIMNAYYKETKVKKEYTVAQDKNYLYQRFGSPIKR